MKRGVKREVDDNEDVESVNSEEFNDMLDRMGSGQDFDDLDIAADIVPRKKKKGKMDEDFDDNEEDNDEDSDDQSQDDDIADNDDASEDLDEDNIADDDELQDLSDIDLVDIDNDEDFSDMEFNDSDDGEVLDNELISDLNRKLLANKNSKSKEKKKGRGIDSDIFVSAEKFAEMLEEQSKTRGKHGGSNTFNSSDGASVKQIDWETKRHQRLKGSFGKNKRKSVQFNNKQVKRSKR